MSLRSFQRAIVDLTLAPAKARALRHGDTDVLAGYELTGRERARILDIVRQPGISVHCSLSRGNRLEVIVEAFPMTCVLLRPVLRQLVDELWQEHRPSNYQLAGEAAAFAALVRRKIADGALAIEYLAEILAYETTCLELAERTRMRAAQDAAAEAMVEFEHDPDALLPPLSRLTAPPAGLPSGSYRALVKLQNARFTVELLEPSRRPPE
jgi:hypothetical protein